MIRILMIHIFKVRREGSNLRRKKITGISGN